MPTARPRSVTLTQLLTILLPDEAKGPSPKPKMAQAMFIRCALEVEMVRTLAPKASDTFIAELEMSIGYQQVT